MAKRRTAILGKLDALKQDYDKVAAEQAKEEAKKQKEAEQKTAETRTAQVFVPLAALRPPSQPVFEPLRASAQAFVPSAADGATALPAEPANKELENKVTTALSEFGQVLLEIQRQQAHMQISVER